MRRSSVDSKLENEARQKQKLLPFLKIKYHPGANQTPVYNKLKKKYLENQKQTAQEVEH